MSRARVNATNRTVLALIGLVLLAAGIGGLLLSLNLIAPGTGRWPVVPDAVAGFATGTWWLPWAAATAAVVVALLGLWWLLAQFRVDWPSQLDLTGDRSDGTTTLAASAFTDAVEDDAESIRGVTGASATLRSKPTRRLDLTVNLAAFADLGEVRRRLEQQTAARSRQVIDQPNLPIRIELRPTRRERRLVQ
jgi:membrane protein implicated in regulation of membrane protease activity